ncbi:MAG: peptidoglycan DD-metalloendopeptidase family protein [Candidatus Niyogibacteria bacterium]|nr:peptidoglycan DD-metalloendopeptidase family protein [Candidatus Niyogibacteria bacterium]
MLKTYIQLLVCSLAVLGLFIMEPYSLDAARIDELRTAIQDHRQEIELLEAEIKEYQRTITETEREVRTFSSEVARLNTIIKKLQADIVITERRIDFTEALIEKLSIEIVEKEEKIKEDRVRLAAFIREINENSSQSLIEVLLANASLSDFFSTLHYFNTLQYLTQQELADLRISKLEFEEEIAARAEEHQNLAALSTELQDRNAIEKTTRDEKAYLLKATKEKEDEYRELLDDRLEKKDALEEEIRNIEEEIRITIDPASLPGARSGVLGWPLEDIALESCFAGGQGKANCVTQFFGNTDFATKNPQIYNSKGHNGIDFRATTGSQTFASESGIVRAVGDTDTQCRSVSYGKWILIDHPNNLSTLYAHLSKITLREGESVTRGQRIGYSGSTGYSTGPHLHYAVFASQAVQNSSIISKICGVPLYLPISPPNGYLNPLSYL